MPKKKGDSRENRRRKRRGGEGHRDRRKKEVVECRAGRYKKARTAYIADLDRKRDDRLAGINGSFFMREQEVHVAKEVVKNGQECTGQARGGRKGEFEGRRGGGEESLAGRHFVKVPKRKHTPQHEGRK